MKKIFSKRICVTVIATAIITFVCTPTFTVDTMADSEGIEFSASSDSTWGDLYRSFEPEEFQALSEEIQLIYDSTLLKDTNTNYTYDIVKDNKALLEDMRVMSRVLETVKFDDDMTVVSTMGYLYSIDGESIEVEEDSKLNAEN